MSNNSVVEIYQQLCQTPKFDVKRMPADRHGKFKYEIYHAPTDTRFFSVDPEIGKQINDYMQLRIKLNSRITTTL